MKKQTLYIGNDVHKDFIRIAVFREQENETLFEKTIKNDKKLIQKIYERLYREYKIEACYEAGVGGYVMYRWLKEIGIESAVIAPSLIPKRSGDKIKTDSRDARNLAKLYRAGELTQVHVPTEQEEADRCIIRLREQIKKKIHQSKQHILKFLQTKGIVYREGKNWTEKHWWFLKKIILATEEELYVYKRYLSMLEGELMELRCIEERIEKLAQSERYVKSVNRLRCLKGIDTLSAITIICEVVDFDRFAKPSHLMGYFGLTPSQYSSGNTHRMGKITATGNKRVRQLLVESAWHYRHRPNISKELQKRQKDQNSEVIEYAWKAQKRLNQKFINLGNRKNKNVAAVAVARELSGFIWSLMVNKTKYA